MEARSKRLGAATRERSRALRRDSTDAERKLWAMLRRKLLSGARFRRQYRIGGYFADFCCIERRLVIEVDGGQHAVAHSYDATRTAFLESQGFRILRFWNNDVLANPEAVVEAILRQLDPS